MKKIPTNISIANSIKNLKNLVKWHSGQSIGDSKSDPISFCNFGKGLVTF